MPKRWNLPLAYAHVRSRLPSWLALSDLRNSSQFLLLLNLPCGSSGVKTIPRDSSGSYSLPPGTLVNSGDTVLPSQHNPAMQDIAQALTGSLPRSGAASMLGDLPMNNNRIRLVANGVDPGDAVNVSQLQGLGVPLGVVVDFWGTTLPDNFMLCAGQEVSRTEFADLFAVIGTAAGAGNGTTTFNLPDYRGRVAAGLDNMGGAAAGRLTGFTATTMGNAGGASTVTLTTAQMPSHTHSGTTGSAGAHTHNTQLYSPTDTGNSPLLSVSSGQLRYSNVNGGILSAGAHTHSFTTGSAGSGSAHPNVQPTIVANKIMRVR